MHRTPIKIMYLMDQYCGNYGGTEGQLFELIKGLDRRIFQPHLVVFRSTPYDVAENNNFPCPISVLDIGKLSTFHTLVKLYKLSQIIRKARFKIVNIYFNDASIVAPFFCKLSSAKVIVSRRDMGFWYTPLNLKALRVSNLFVDLIISNSNAVKLNVHKLEKYPLYKTRVLYNGLNKLRFKTPPLPEFRERFGIGANDPIIGMVANLYRIKRHSDIIYAFSIVREKYKNAHLVLIGEGEMRSALEELVCSLNLQDIVHFLGSVANVGPIIKHFSVGVLCSQSEGFSNAIMEYMACGIPTVCTNVGGNSEIIKDGHNGYLVEVADITSIAERINKILSDNLLYENLKCNAQRIVEERFSDKKMVDLHTNLYKQLINGKQEGNVSGQDS